MLKNYRDSEHPGFYHCIWLWLLFFFFPSLFLVFTHPTLFSFSIHSFVDIHRSRNFLGHLLHSQFPTHSGNNVFLQAPLVPESSGNFSITRLLGHMLLTFHLQVCCPNWKKGVSQAHLNTLPFNSDGFNPSNCTLPAAVMPRGLPICGERGGWCMMRGLLGLTELGCHRAAYLMCQGWVRNQKRDAVSCNVMNTVSQAQAGQGVCSSLACTVWVV